MNNNDSVQLDSKYVAPDEFDNFHENKTESNQVFSMIHFICRSIRRNVDDLSMFLSCFKHKFSLIGLTETWLKEDEAPLFQLPDYKFVTKCRNDRRGGGVGMYVRSDLQFHRKTDLEASI